MASGDFVAKLYGERDRSFLSDLIEMDGGEDALMLVGSFCDIKFSRLLLLHDVVS